MMTLLFARPLRNRYLFLGDVILLAAAAYFSYVLRLETFDMAEHWPGCLLFTGLAIVIVPLVFWRAGIYSHYWRYASVEELMLLAGSVTIGAVLAGSLTLIAARVLTSGWQMPRSIPPIFVLLTLAVTGGSRLLLRLAAPSNAYWRSDGRTNGAPGQPVFIMGAGDAGAMIVRELQNNPQLGLDPVGFLDDDRGKHEAKIHGVPVLGDRHAIPVAVKQHKVRQVIIAMPTAPGAEIRDIVRICGEAGVQARIIPGIYELLDGSVSVKQVRDVRIEDLLRREPVCTDISAVRDMVRGKQVLVTGAGGSIGSELCRQIARCEPAQLILLGHGENSIFEISNELQHLYPSVRATPVIADLRDYERLTAIFGRHRPEIVFHAAAHKHVPLMEANVEDVITNNVLGAIRLVEACIASGVTRFVQISTDKAVNPTSVMGASKRVAELIVQQAAHRTGRSYVAVRFGNVLGSRGSVVPFFQEQIAAGGPVTVTHPDMRRYFMTIPEAVQLVLQAAVLGKGGEVFVLDMGEPVRIVDLASDLIRLSGLEPGHDIEITFSGLRPGEKLFEEIFADREKFTRTIHDKIFVCRNGASPEGAPATLDAFLATLIAAARSGEPTVIKRLLHELVPEYQPDETGAVLPGYPGVRLADTATRGRPLVSADS